MAKKGKWSKEAKERYSQMMKEKYGKEASKSQSLSIIREQEAKERIQEAIMNIERFIAKRDFGYDAGIEFEHGQIVQLLGLPNDGKLISLGYVIQWNGSDSELNDCLQCGKEFGSTSGYNKHVAKHYNHCVVCNKDIPPEIWTKHQDAHQVLA